MVGSGRSFAETGFLNKLEEIEGYTVSDIQKFRNYSGPWGVKS